MLTFKRRIIIDWLPDNGHLGRDNSFCWRILTVIYDIKYTNHSFFTLQKDEMKLSTFSNNHKSIWSKRTIIIDVTLYIDVFFPIRIQINYWTDKPLFWYSFLFHFATILKHVDCKSLQKIKCEVFWFA